MKTRANILESYDFKIAEKEPREIKLIENLAGAIYTCNADGYINFYNKKAVELWGREPEIGKDLWCGSWKIFEADGETRMPLDTCPMAITLKQGRSVRNREIVVQRPDGIKLNVMPHPDPIFDEQGKITGAVNMLVDITELKQKEKALRESEERYKQIAAELEQRVEDRTKDLKEVNITLQHKNEELEQYAYIASHDLQEPLRKIKTFSSRLEIRATEHLDETCLKYLAKIKSSSERMSNLINDILTYSRLQHLEEHFIETDLNEVLNNIIEDFEVKIEQKTLSIRSETLPKIKALPMQMNQLFHNIIGNSVKFSKEDKKCRIYISCSKLAPKEALKEMKDDSKNYIEIIFRDNGIGFKPEYAENIFRIFERLNSSERYAGTGIGLALCKKIVEVHQGKIYAKSNTDKGASIHVILPSEK